MDLFNELKSLCNILICLNIISVILNVISVILSIINKINSKKESDSVSENEKHSYKVNNENKQLSDDSKNHISKEHIEPG